MSYFRRAAWPGPPPRRICPCEWLGAGGAEEVDLKSTESLDLAHRPDRESESSLPVRTANASPLPLPDTGAMQVAAISPPDFSITHPSSSTDASTRGASGAQPAFLRHSAAANRPSRLQQHQMDSLTAETRARRCWATQ